jgi:hypothetical protein
MAVWDWFFRKRAQRQPQDQESVKVRTKMVDDNWVHVSVPKAMAAFDSESLAVPSVKKEGRKKYGESGSEAQPTRLRG